MAEDRYRVVVGLSIVPNDAAGFSDFGLVYHDMPYNLMVQVEGVFAQHAEVIQKAMGPMIEDLVAMGVMRIEEKEQKAKSVSEASKV